MHKSNNFVPKYPQTHPFDKEDKSKQEIRMAYEKLIYKMTAPEKDLQNLIFRGLNLIYWINDKYHSFSKYMVFGKEGHFQLYEKVQNKSKVLWGIYNFDGKTIKCEFVACTYEGTISKINEVTVEVSENHESLTFKNKNISGSMTADKYDIGSDNEEDEKKRCKSEEEEKRKQKEKNRRINKLKRERTIMNEIKDDVVNSIVL